MKKVKCPSDCRFRTCDCAGNPKVCVYAEEASEEPEKTGDGEDPSPSFVNFYLFYF